MPSAEVEHFDGQPTDLAVAARSLYTLCAVPYVRYQTSGERKLMCRSDPTKKKFLTRYPQSKGRDYTMLESSKRVPT